MRKSTRILIGLAVIEAMLAGGAGYMMAQTRSGAWKTDNQGEAIRVITEIMGGAMGVAAGVLLVAFFFQRRQGN